MSTSAYYAVGFAYAVLYVVLAFRKPRIALMLILAAAPLQQDLSISGSTRFSLAEVNLVLMLVVFGIHAATRMERLRIGPTLIPVLLYLAVCGLSAARHWLDTAPSSIVQVGLYLIGATALFASFPVTDGDLFFALRGFLFVCISLAFASLALGTNFVFGLHKNGLGGSLTGALIIALELWYVESDSRRRAVMSGLIVIVTAALVYTLSRGAWLGTIVGLLVMMGFRGRLKPALRVGLILVPATAILWVTLPAEKREYATDLRAESYNVSARLVSIDIAQASFQQDPLFGNGVGLRKMYDATNVVWLTLAETGIIGLAAFALIHLTFYRAAWDGRQSLHPADPARSFIVIGASLVSAKLAHGLVDHYWGRGMLLVAWATAGMVIRIGRRSSIASNGMGPLGGEELITGFLMVQRRHLRSMRYPAPARRSGEINQAPLENREV